MGKSTFSRRFLSHVPPPPTEPRSRGSGPAWHTEAGLPATDAAGRDRVPSPPGEPGWTEAHRRWSGANGGPEGPLPPDGGGTSWWGSPAPTPGATAAGGTLWGTADPEPRPGSCQPAALLGAGRGRDQPGPVSHGARFPSGEGAAPTTGGGPPVTKHTHHRAVTGPLPLVPSRRRGPASPLLPSPPHTHTPPARCRSRRVRGAARRARAQECALQLNSGRRGGRRGGSGPAAVSVSPQGLNRAKPGRAERGGEGASMARRGCWGGGSGVALL